MTRRGLDGVDKLPHRVQNRHFPTIKHLTLEQAQHLYAVFFGFDKMSEGRE